MSVEDRWNSGEEADGESETRGLVYIGICQASGSGVNRRGSLFQTMPKHDGPSLERSVL